MSLVLQFPRYVNVNSHLFSARTTVIIYRTCPQQRLQLCKKYNNIEIGSQKIPECIVSETSERRPFPSIETCVNASLVAAQSLYIHSNCVFANVILIVFMQVTHINVANRIHIIPNSHGNVSHFFHFHIRCECACVQFPPASRFCFFLIQAFRPFELMATVYSTHTYTRANNLIIIMSACIRYRTWPFSVSTIQFEISFSFQFGVGHVMLMHNNVNYSPLCAGYVQWSICYVSHTLAHHSLACECVYVWGSLTFISVQSLSQFPVRLPFFFVHLSNCTHSFVSSVFFQSLHSFVISVFCCCCSACWWWRLKDSLLEDVWQKHIHHRMSLPLT